MANRESPSKQTVKGARQEAQDILGLGITAAQDWCAALVHTSRRAWQQWEDGDRSMHPAFWELFQYKSRRRLSYKTKAPSKSH